MLFLPNGRKSISLTVIGQKGKTGIIPASIVVLRRWKVKIMGFLALAAIIVLTFVCLVAIINSLYLCSLDSVCCPEN